MRMEKNFNSILLIHVIWDVYFILNLFIIDIYMAASGLSCNTQNLRCSVQASLGTRASL